MSRRAGVELKTSGQERFATMASLPRRRRPFHFLLLTHGLPEACRFRPVSSLIYGLARIRTGREAVVSGPIGFKSRMHFGYYLMIAALVLMGLEVLYALYQLATFL